MFREMRRKKQQIPETEVLEILDRASHGVLAVLGDGGYPYAVPLSYVYTQGKIFFHCAKSGHKLDAIRGCDRASFCVVDRDEVIPEHFTSLYKSVIAFGRVREITDEAEMLAAVTLLARKYSPDEPQEALDAEIKREWAPLAVLELTIDHITGKESRELMMQRDK